MTHWPIIHRETTRAHKRESLRTPKRFRELMEWLHEYLDDNPKATAAEVERAGTREGFDPATLYLLALIVGTVIELWIKFYYLRCER